MAAVQPALLSDSTDEIRGQELPDLLLQDAKFNTNAGLSKES